MTSPLRSLTAAVASVFCLAAATAQSPVDIGLFQNGNTLEIKVRPQSDFDGIFSSIVFTLRWDRNMVAAIGPVSQAKGASTYMPIQTSGAVRQSGDHNYQVFAGFGMESVSSAGAPWRAGQEYTIATIPFTGQAEFSIVEDAWTKEISNNGDYYISLGGEDKTGIVYKSIAGMNGEPGMFSISPNPNLGEFVLTMPVSEEDKMWFEIVNSAGQVVMRETPNTGGNLYRKELDLRGEGAGVYHIRIHRNTGIENHRVVVN